MVITDPSWEGEIYECHHLEVHRESGRVSVQSVLIHWNRKGMNLELRDI